jgi:ABC-type oligopeptide transport system substrate-binding subunit
MPPNRKVLHMFLSTSETGLDPAAASDIATLSLLENLFDPLLRYDYLARPVKLRPNTATAMPEISPTAAAIPSTSAPASISRPTRPSRASSAR